jgi:hypothetical protein
MGKQVPGAPCRYAPLLALLLCASPLAADSLTLRDGTVIRGHFVSGTPQKIIFQDHNGVWRRFDVKQVRGIDFSTGAVHAGAEETADRAASFIAVRAEEAIEPEKVAAGRTFLATIVEDIRGADGTVIIPGGSAARMMVRPLAGGAAPNYEVELESVMIDGNRYVVYGDAIAAGQRQADEDGSTGEGTGEPVKVSGARISVPAGAVLEFRLEQPLLLRQAAD